MRSRQYNQILRELEELYTLAEAEKWMASAHILLNGRRPMDCMPGEVWEIIDQLKSGAYT